MDEPTGFDPARHLTKVSGRDYLEVKWRLVWFHDVHPDGSIVTEMVQHQNSAAVFKAAVSWPTESGIAMRTGWGSESSDDFGDYLEKAETKAIGRALAAAGFGTQFSGSEHEFGGDNQRVVDSPVDIRSGRSSGSTISRAEPTPRQVRYLHAAARDAGLSNEQLEAMARGLFNADVSELDRRSVSSMIEQIQAGRPPMTTTDAPQASQTPQPASGQAPMPISTNGSAGPITDAQKGTIRNLLDPDTAEETAQRMFGKPLRGLTTEEAHELIEVERRAMAARN